MHLFEPVVSAPAVKKPAKETLAPAAAKEALAPSAAAKKTSVVAKEALVSALESVGPAVSALESVGPVVYALASAGPFLSAPAVVESVVSAPAVKEPVVSAAATVSHLSPFAKACCCRYQYGLPLSLLALASC
jgi:hypothetical protein